MRNAGTWRKISWLLVVIFFVSISDVRSQDLAKEMDNLKKEVAELQNELSDLQNLVFQLRRAVLKSATTLPAQPLPPSPSVSNQPQPTDIIRCCNQGRCLRVTKEGCDKFGGYVVADCNQCQ